MHLGNFLTTALEISPTLLLLYFAVELAGVKRKINHIGDIVAKLLAEKSEKQAEELLKELRKEEENAHIPIG